VNDLAGMTAIGMPTVMHSQVLDSDEERTPTGRLYRTTSVHF
jgi:hypothetical protein